jgi:hypothetical protein
MRQFIFNHRVWVYFSLTLVLSWIPWFMGAPQELVLVPFVMAVIFALVLEGRSGLWTFLKRCVRWRVSPFYWVATILLPLSGTLLALSIHFMLGGTLPRFELLTDSIHLLPFAFIYLIPPFGGAVMELALSGYAVPQLEQRYGGLASAIIAGSFLAIWFMPQFFAEGTPQAQMGGISFFPFFLMTEIGMMMMMVTLFNLSNYSSLVGGYFVHAWANIWTLILLVELDPEADGLGVLPVDSQLFQIVAMSYLAVGITLAVITKGTLAYRPQTHTTS